MNSLMVRTLSYLSLYTQGLVQFLAHSKNSVNACGLNKEKSEKMLIQTLRLNREQVSHTYKTICYFMILDFLEAKRVLLGLCIHILFYGAKRLSMSYIFGKDGYF